MKKYIILLIVFIISLLFYTAFFSPKSRIHHLNVDYIESNSTNLMLSEVIDRLDIESHGYSVEYHSDEIKNKRANTNIIYTTSDGEQNIGYFLDVLSLDYEFNYSVTLQKVICIK